MSFKQFLKEYQQNLQPFLVQFFEKEERLASKVSNCSIQQLRILRDFLTGGKRSRGALIVLGYLCAGGKDNDEIIKTSLAIEIQHGALLIHDDIIDSDDIRHGKPAIHRQYEEIHRSKSLQGDSAHFGIAMGIDEGDVGIFLALKILAAARFDPLLKEKAFEVWSDFLLKTAYGEGLDVFVESQKKARDKDVLAIHRFKTAYYTIIGPLQMGAVFAGAHDQALEAIADFGESVGIAFQLRDDELGLFADQKELGKPIGSDIREGKNTILRSKTLEFTKDLEKKFIQKTYGKKDITLDEIEKVKKITIECGALDYSQKIAQSLVAKGKKFIPKITQKKEYQEILYDLADFMIKRER